MWVLTVLARSTLHFLKAKNICLLSHKSTCRIAMAFHASVVTDYRKQSFRQITVSWSFYNFHVSCQCCFHSNIIITNHYKLIQHGQELSHRHQRIRVSKVKPDKDWEGWANRSLLTRRRVVSAKSWELSNQFVHSWGRVKWEVRKWEMVSKVFTFLSVAIPLLKAPWRLGIQLPCVLYPKCVEQCLTTIFST